MIPKMIQNEYRMYPGSFVITLPSKCFLNTNSSQKIAQDLFQNMP